MAKCCVNGYKCHDVYTYLRLNSKLNYKQNEQVGEISGNFDKFIVSGKGEVLHYYTNQADPINLQYIIEQYIEDNYFKCPDENLFQEAGVHIND